MYDDIQYSERDGIAELRFDRPEVKNAFREATIAELNDALVRADRTDRVYCIVLSGTDGAFCAGADVQQMPDWNQRSKEEYAGFLWGVQNIVRRLMGAKPTIAAVEGPAVGAGCDFALACDIRVMHPDAFLREGFVQNGLVPGDGGAWLLPRLVGWSKATEFLLTGRDIDADTAEDLGLVAALDGDCRAVAWKFAGELRDLPAIAVRSTNALLDPGLSFEEHCTRAIEYQWRCINDAEHEEAIQAFIEDRDPEFDREYS